MKNQNKGYTNLRLATRSIHIVNDGVTLELSTRFSHWDLTYLNHPENLQTKMIFFMCLSTEKTNKTYFAQIPTILSSQIGTFELGNCVKLYYI